MRDARVCVRAARVLGVQRQKGARGGMAGARAQGL